ncbi:MAG: hypothetical protein K9G67_11135 [Bacteroidales bacterium]|nr:hypothetical protein [Bacteroidales bacterium]MCF8343911.1 hypothetical protein [Bacteroidales bacterium]MCF8351312.1 hypothetical protein [Bacteroidales bacterium]MCF8376900.1 hypothetical protein [Bacteroidales bacterium]MCF8400831.1 hypothetical protein [Bacteroidales bacterium]
MSNEERSFKENLDLLIKLFKKLKGRTDIKEIPGIDKNMYQNFDLFLNNYEMMRDQISDELLMQFGEPMKKMIADLVDQLKDELGEETEIKEEETPQRQELRKDVKQIDQLLKNPNLSKEEIDRLLDERMKLKQNKGNDQLSEE